MGIVNRAVVNLRSYPSLAGEVVGQAKQGERLAILATSPDGLWLQVCCPLGTSEGNQQRWVAAAFVRVQPPLAATKPVGTVANPASLARNAVRGTGTGTVVNLRRGPGAEYAVVGHVREQTLIELTGRNEPGTWWRLGCPAGAPPDSWISAEFVALALPTEEVLARVPVVSAPATPP